MDQPKIQLSFSEADLMQNREVILTKNSVLKKIRNLLENLQEEEFQFAHQRGLDMSPYFSSGPKISRGENYEGMPYLILDYPRYSNKGDLFFIRTFFWWGHFFSTTLHLAGKTKQQFLESILQSYHQVREFSIGTNTDPWVHHFESGNYQLIGDLSQHEFNKAAENFSHIKLAARWPLEQWEEAPENLFADWKKLLAVCRLIT